MKAKYFVVCKDDVVATIYEHDKFDKVIVFRTDKIDLEYSLQLYNIGEAEEEENIDLLKLILAVIPS